MTPCAQILGLKREEEKKERPHKQIPHLDKNAHTQSPQKTKPPAKMRKALAHLLLLLLPDPGLESTRKDSKTTWRCLVGNGSALPLPRRQS